MLVSPVNGRKQNCIPLKTENKFRKEIHSSLYFLKIPGGTQSQAGCGSRQLGLVVGKQQGG